VMGPVTGTVGVTYTFTAAVVPTDATGPITYIWSPAPDSGEGATVSYTWLVTGLRVITVTAENCGGVVTDTHAITIEALPPVCYPLADVDLAGPVSGTVGVPYSFTATITPGTATTPVTYTWGTVVSGSLSVVSYTWETTGTKWVTVTAENRCGEAVSDTHSVIIEVAPPVTYMVYLPVVVKELPLTVVEEAPDECPGYGARVGWRYREDFDHESDDDWFTFDVVAGQTYIIETGDLGPEADTYLYLWAGNCAVKLAEDDNGGGGLASRIEWTATKDGPLAAMVQSWDWEVWGEGTEYTLTIREVSTD